MKSAIFGGGNPQPNTLYYGDCLEIMKHFPDEWIDLICLDPPFNSNEKYNKPFKGSGMNIDPQIKAFDDTWNWNDTAAERVENVKSAPRNPASKVISAFETFIPRSKMLAYTSYMAERLFGMHQILKPTGSIYLHCDPYASHYLKLIMDAIFGEKNFRNEIVWHYEKWTNNARFFQRNHDIVLMYSVSDNYVYNKQYGKITKRQRQLVRTGYNTGSSGGKQIVRIYDRENPNVQRRLPDWVQEGRTIYDVPKPSGKALPDVWDIPIVNSQATEYMGYRTQKPIPLYERMIKASSNEGDLVLDPFCGCGTTIDAALKNNRRAIGIDILPYALNLINDRRLGVELPVEGIPVSVETAVALAKSKPKGAEKFQDWAISLVDGLASNPDKVGDEGIDGFGMFAHTPDNMDKRGIIVQVTAASGSQINKFGKLQDDVRNHNAAMGILITKDEQTAQHRWPVNLPMIEFGNTLYPPMQCLSIAEYFRNGKQYQPPLKLPPLTDPWTGKPMQPSLFDPVQPA